MERSHPSRKLGKPTFKRRRSDIFTLQRRNGRRVSPRMLLFQCCTVHGAEAKKACRKKKKQKQKQKQNKKTKKKKNKNKKKAKQKKKTNENKKQTNKKQNNQKTNKNKTKQPG